MKKLALVFLFAILSLPCLSWGFFAHRRINYFSIFLLPPEMMVLYKPYADFLLEHAVDPDKRRYAIPQEAARHFIDMDHYGKYPFDLVPKKWKDATATYIGDTLNKYGIAPWWIQAMLYRLTDAFKEKSQIRILKLSAELGHYIADSHVPLHANTNHNGQLTGQKGIHAFWESRIPEMMADTEWDFFIGKAEYIRDPATFIWQRVIESAVAADTVLSIEQALTRNFPPDQKFSFEDRNGLTIRQYSSAFSRAYDSRLKGMIERRMRQSIYAVASFWYTAWINAGQPDLSQLSEKDFSPVELAEFEELNMNWKKGNPKGRDHE